jgi:hypothetical protein
MRKNVWASVLNVEVTDPPSLSDRIIDFNSIPIFHNLQFGRSIYVSMERRTPISTQKSPLVAHVEREGMLKTISNHASTDMTTQLQSQDPRNQPWNLERFLIVLSPDKTDQQSQGDSMQSRNLGAKSKSSWNSCIDSNRLRKKTQFQSTGTVIEGAPLPYVLIRDRPCFRERACLIAAPHQWNVFDVILTDRRQSLQHISVHHAQPCQGPVC